jgi:hypothetical protein
LLNTSLKRKNSNFLNESTLTVEHESCRPNYPLSFSKRLYTPSIPINQVVLDKVSVKHWECKSWITFKLLSLKIWKLYEYICLAKYFHKSIYMLVFNTYFYKNKKSKLHFGDRVAVLNDLIYGYGGSIY